MKDTTGPSAAQMPGPNSRRIISVLIPSFVSIAGYRLLSPRRINGTRVYTKQDRARLARILRAKSLGSPLSEIKLYLDMYGQHGEGRIQQLQFVIDKTAAAMDDLKRKRAQIDATLAELQLINETCRKTIEDKRRARERQRSA